MALLSAMAFLFEFRTQKLVFDPMLYIEMTNYQRYLFHQLVLFSVQIKIP